MANTKATQLPPKYWKALELIEEGTLSLKEIARTIGMSQWTLYELMSGNTKKTGTTGELFYAELRIMHARNVNKVKHLHKDNQRLALIQINERLRQLNDKPPTKAISEEICRIMNAVGKAQPNVEITNNSWSYTKGLSAEEMIHEFKRLGSLARSALDAKGVPGPKQGGSGALPESDVGRGKLEEQP